MKKLNELAEQAKFVADWHGSDWSSALCQDKDGKQAHEIICESRGEAVISTGSNSNEASWLCDYLELCSPANILAIAEAFRALEERAEAAEAKLAELANKKPDIMVSAEGAEAIRAIMNREMSAAGRYVTLKRPSRIGEEGLMGIYIRPAPAADLAELVPKKLIHHTEDYPVQEAAKRSWNACVDAMLRNIEDAK